MERISIRLSSRSLKNMFAPRIALQLHVQEEVSIASSLEWQDLIFEFFSCEREGELSLFLAFYRVLWIYTQCKEIT